MIDEGLRQFATVRQLEIIDAFEKYGSLRKTAKGLGVCPGTIQRSLEGLKARAAKQGYSPDHDMTRTVPDGYMVKGVSTYYNAEGKPSGQWVKSSIDSDRQLELIKSFVLTLAEDIKGISSITEPPKYANDDLLTVIPMGDPHFGLYAWQEDAGDNFDLAIAEQLTCSAIDRLIASSPNSKTALLLNLGDMFHADNQKNVTSSGHQLDVDGRWAKVQQVGLKAIIYALKRLLEKHEKVIFRINKGNHDGHSSYALALMISCYFTNEPRMHVDLSPAVSWYYQFGKVLIGSTHGDTVKGRDMLSIMAADKCL